MEWKVRRGADRSAIESAFEDDGSLDRSTIRAYRDEVIRSSAQVLTRLIDDAWSRCMVKVESAFHIGSVGEEAAILGSAYAMREKDGVSCYREFCADLMRASRSKP